MFKLRRGGQGNALTGPVFVLTIDPVLKFNESKFEGVDVWAIQDDVTTVVHPKLSPTRPLRPC